jgi:hypothetical protein
MQMWLQSWRRWGLVMLCCSYHVIALAFASTLSLLSPAPFRRPFKPNMNIFYWRSPLLMSLEVKTKKRNYGISGLTVVSSSCLETFVTWWQ